MTSPPTIELDGQYRALREEAGFAARDELAALRIGGADAVEYLQSQLTNDIEALADGAGCYAALLDRKGRMRADMRVLRIRADRLVVLLERLATDAAAAHLRMYSVGREVKTEDASGSLGVVAVEGPAAFELAGVPPLRREHDNEPVELGGIECTAARTQHGFDLLCPADARADIELALAGAGLVPVSAAALEIRRVESGRPRFGREMTDRTMPQEAGINERAVSFTKGCYIGQETVARLHYKGKPNRHLRGLRSDKLLREGEPVFRDEREVGRIGTAVLSPALGPLALAILRREAEPGTTVSVGEGVPAQVSELPFLAE